MKKPIFIIYIFLVSATIFSQNGAKIDSLKQVISNAQERDSLKVDAYVRLVKSYKRINEDSCRVYLQSLSNFASQNKSSLAFYHYHYLKAGYFGLFDIADSQVDFIEENLLLAFEKSKEIDNPKLKINILCRLNQEYSRSGKVEKALAYAKQAEQIALDNNLWKEAAYVYGILGELYDHGFSEIDTSLDYLLKSDSIYKVHDYRGKDRGFTLSSIGDIYKSLDQVSQAKKYQNQARELFIEANDEYQEMYILGKLASIERIEKNYDKALEYMITSINYYANNKYPFKEAMYHIGLSEIYFESNQIDKAIEAGQRAIDLSRRNKHDFGVVIASINQAKILQSNQSYAESNKLALAVEDLAIEMNSYIDLVDIYELLYTNSDAQGRYELAFDYIKKYKIANDTLVSRKNLQQAKELEAQYKNEQQQQEINLLQSKNDLAEAKQQNQRYLIWGIAIFSFVGLLTLYLLYKNRQKTNKRLKELDVAKTSFFQNISHEFRTPLSLIYGPIERILSENKLPESEKSDLQLMQRNTHRLNELVDQILDVSKLEANQWQLRVSEIQVSSLLKSIAASFEFQAQQKQLQYHVDVSETNTIWLDKDVIEKITTNLLSNAVKYTPSGGFVTFNSSVKDGTINLTIENSGGHFTDEEIRLLFDRYVRLESKTKNAGTGIGLALVQQLVNLCNGTIEVKNTQEDHVRFQVQLPAEKSAYKAHQIMTTSNPEEYTILDSLDENNENPVLLIVDDHPDIRAFIKNSFQDSYQIIEASNGSLGVKTALAMIPDIIISDVMMPELSGTQLCKQLKQDERTCHIPIVLLSAKDDVESNFHGIEVGADDYIAKPFSYKLLKSKLQSLIESRAKLRARYSKEIVLKPTEISINSADERFIEKVKEVLDAHLADDSFTVEKFSESMTMSRMQLHRKLKALTGLTTSEFLRTERLKVAAVLLKDPSLNINEIGYQVGFSSPSYFTKCFKEVYGMLPSEYQKNL